MLKILFQTSGFPEKTYNKCLVQLIKQTAEIVEIYMFTENQHQSSHALHLLIEFLAKKNSAQVLHNIRLFQPGN